MPGIESQNSDSSFVVFFFWQNEGEKYVKKLPPLSLYLQWNILLINIYLICYFIDF